MRRLIQKIIAAEHHYLLEIRIRERLMLIFSSGLIVLLLISLISISALTQTYNVKLHDTAANILNLSTSSLENELKRSELLTYNILADKNIQTDLQSWSKLYIDQDGGRTGNIDYQVRVLSLEVKAAIDSYAAGDNLLSSVYYIDTRDILYAGNINTGSKPTEAIQRELLAAAQAAAGAAVYVIPDDGSNTLFVVRQIRSTENLSFANLGTIALSYSLSNVVKGYIRSDFGNDQALQLLMGKRVIQSTADITIPGTILDRMTAESGYFIANIDRTQYLLSYTTSQYTGWTYVSLIGYGSIFNRLNQIRTMILILVILLFSLINLLIWLMTFRLTKPLEHLSQRMKQLEKGKFKLPPNPDYNPVKKDEISMIVNNFEDMAVKIDDLIQHDYINQMIIQETQFKTLQAQVNPHFLYNTLETINWMAKIRKEPEISSVVEALGKLLRNSISNRETSFSIQREIDVLDSYITIQKVRYGERLIYECQIDPEFLDYEVPKMLLQPLVENAINYGLEPIMAPCTIRVYSQVSGPELRMVVEDNGPGISPEAIEKLRLIKIGQIKSTGSGIGLSNVDKRIRIFFGDDYGLTIGNRPGGGTRVVIHLPAEGGPIRPNRPQQS